MIVTPDREAVIQNIKKNAAEGRFNDKVEINDPILTSEERTQILSRYLKERQRPAFRLRNWTAGRIADVYTWYENRNTEIIGLENVKGITDGAFITSNHFNPTENTAIRRLSQKMKQGNLYIVSQDTNLKMTGLFGFFMNFMDIIPIGMDREYLSKHFDRLIEEAFQRKQNILWYPEQEMWFNYRKPRPPKRGVYYYAAKLGRPIISCFTEIQELPKMVTPEFHDVKYILHVLQPIFPDPTKSLRDSSKEMMYKDHQQKVRCYEEVYGKKLTYEFSSWDIAGWVPGNGESEE